MSSMARRNQTGWGVAFDIFNWILFFALMLVMLFPLLYVFVGSFSARGLANMRFGAFSLDAYQTVFSSRRMLGSILNSFTITVVGTLLCMVVTSLSAYGLSKRDLPGQKWLLRMVIFFMLFSPGLVPNYIWEANTLGMIDTYWALWIPCLITSSNLIIMKNFFAQLPESIEESARIDGCNELQSFARIILPMSKAAIATFSLFYAVNFWNNYQRPMIFLNTPEKWPVTIWMRQIIILSQGTFGEDVPPDLRIYVPANAVKYATIVVSTVPIICVYPFLQKHFTKGVLIGSVKG